MYICRKKTCNSVRDDCDQKQTLECKSSALERLAKISHFKGGFLETDLEREKHGARLNSKTTVRDIGMQTYV